MLNAGVHPIVPRTGSIGAGDLCLLAHVGLVVLGEGEAEVGGERMAGGEALGAAGIAAPAVGPGDGLALRHIQRRRELVAAFARELETFSRHDRPPWLLAFTPPTGRGRRETPGEGPRSLDRR